MEIRKFLVEIKPDGRVYATEYLDSERGIDLYKVKKMLRELMFTWERQVEGLMKDNTPVSRTLAHGIMCASEDLEAIYNKF